MAAPFYNPADQAIYEGGQHFIPQEQYRLNYTAPAIMGQNTNAGIAATGAANPYKWPYPKGEVNTIKESAELKLHIRDH